MRVRPLDDKFWSQFAKTTWERKSVAIKNISSPLLEMDEAQIFKLLVQYSDRCRRLKSADGMKFYIEGRRQYDDEVLKLLPKKKDRTLLGYHARMNEIFEDYGLVCDELLQVNHEKQEQLAEFTGDLYRHVGFPNRFAEMGLYLGNYRKTPFGVHEDACGVFSFPVVGRKTFRIWSPDYVAKNPKLVRAFRYSQHKDASQVLTAGPGDMTYWPSKAWHIAESDGRFSATWSLGVWVDRAHREDVAQVVHQLVSHADGSSANLRTTPFKELHSDDGEIAKLPQLHQESIRNLKRLSSASLESAFAKHWMLHISKQGFKTRPFANPTAHLRSGASIRLTDKRSPILWLQAKDDAKIYFSFNGVMSEGSNSKALLKLIKDLNRGDTCALGLNRAHAETKILRQLADAGAFSIT